MDNEKLKPCPFCGGLPFIREKPEDYGYYPAMCQVKCSICGVETQQYSDGQWATDNTPRHERAAKVWNTRTSDAEINQLLRDMGKLRDALSYFIYETTCLSPREDDGSHWCKISEECLGYGRKLRASTEQYAEAIKKAGEV